MLNYQTTSFHDALARRALGCALRLVKPGCGPCRSRNSEPAQLTSKLPATLKARCVASVERGTAMTSIHRTLAQNSLTWWWPTWARLGRKFTSARIARWTLSAIGCRLGRPAGLSTGACERADDAVLRTSYWTWRHLNGPWLRV
jgi:hypothetical protein